MESNYYHEESSDQEMVSDQENNNDLGVGRSYECVFCKRGFNTAQALGGHMNIHRKDRARNKPNSTKLQESPPPRLYQITPENNIARDHHQPHLTYATHFPAGSSSNSTLYESNCLHHDRGRQLQPLIPGDWRMRLSLEVEDLDKKAMINQEKELDLELRLGYDS